MSLEGVVIINRRSKSTSKAKAFGAEVTPKVLSTQVKGTKVFYLGSGTSYAYFCYQVAIPLAVTYVLTTNSIRAAGVGIVRGCQDSTNPVWY